MSEVTPVKIGDYVKDVVTQFEGYITGHEKHLHGCDRMHVDPGSMKEEGGLKEAYVFDILRLTKVEGKASLPFTSPRPEFDALQQGCIAKDTVTGFKGIISARVETFGGNVVIDLAPTKLNKDGELPKAHGFGAGRVELVQAQPAPVAPEAPKAARGGPTTTLKRATVTR